MSFVSRDLAFLFVLGTFNSFAFYSLVPTLPLYLLNFLAMAYKEIGIVISSFSVSVILFRPVAGFIVDRFGEAKVLRIALFLTSLLYSVYPGVSRLSSFIILRMLHGLLFAITSSSLSCIASSLSSPSRIGSAIALLSLTVPLGMIMGSFFGLKLLDLFGPKKMFLMTFFASFAAFAMSFLVKEKKSLLGIGQSFTLRSLLLKEAIYFAVPMIFPMIIYGSINTFAAIHAKIRGLVSIENFFLIFTVSLLLSRVFTGRLFDRGYIKDMVFSSLFLIFLGTIALSFSFSNQVFLLSAFLCGVGFGILMPSCQAATNVLAEPERRGLANSTYFLSYDLGIGLSSFLLGYLLQWVSMGTMYLSVSFLTVLSGYLFYRYTFPSYEKRLGFRLKD